MKITVVILAAICCMVEGQFGFLPKAPISPGKVNSPLGAVPGGLNPLNILEQQFSGFENKFNKAYSAAEAPLRKANFKDNFEKISQLNEGFTKGVTSVLEEINEFGDMLWDEFSKLFNGFRLSRVGPSRAVPFVPQANETIPESVDWREVGAVSPVKHQQQCAGCWAFSAAGALEGQIQKKTGKLSEVSIQSLLDCAKGERYGNDGCAGGLVETGFDFINDNKGIDADASYPYEAKNGACRHKKDNVVGQCKGYVRVPDGDEKSLEKAVATVGPISAAIHAVPRFQFYKDGIIDYADCGNQPDNLNHAILIVGYGKEADGKEYWLVKNSYGPGWGIDGYFKVAKNAGNKCGIATYARYPEV